MKAYLILGSNLGKRKALLEQAIEMICAKCGAIINQSSTYETEPWGFASHERFLNQVICIETHLNPYELLETLQRIEELLGRIRKGRGYQSRTIDIDILFFGNLQLCDDKLVIPHPEISKRRFVLSPLNEIYPELIHPDFNLSISELLNKCTDSCAVNIWNEHEIS